jgi:hypothetical protein
VNFKDEDNNLSFYFYLFTSQEQASDRKDRDDITLTKWYRRNGDVIFM